MTGQHDFRVVSTETLVESPILTMRRDQVVMPGGVVKPREIIEHFGSVAIVAINDSGQVATVTQYRPAIGERLVELPAGILDFTGETPLEAAQRELQEEAGLAAATWNTLCDIHNSPGFSDEACRIYVARDLSTVDQLNAEGDEEADMTVSWIPLEKTPQMILEGTITNSIAVAGLFAAHYALSDRRELRAGDEDFRERPTALAARRQAAGIVPDMKAL